jgi:type IV pilus assembly protein PilO
MSQLRDIVVGILRRWFLWTLASCLLAWNTYNTFVKEEKEPADIQIASNKVVVQRLTAKIESYEQQAKQIPEKQNQVKQLLGQLDILLSKLPRSFNIAEILRKMNEIAKGSALDFHRFKPAPERTGAEGFYAELPIEMIVRGSYPQILLFFDRLSKQQRIFNVADIKFKAVIDKGSYFVSEVTATATTFRYIEGAQILAPKPAAPGTSTGPAPQAAPPAAGGKT